MMDAAKGQMGQMQDPKAKDSSILLSKGKKGKESEDQPWKGTPRTCWSHQR